MSIQIDCPDIEFSDVCSVAQSCDKCHRSKITVYTAKEINEAVEAERKACAMECVEYYSNFQQPKKFVLDNQYRLGMIRGGMDVCHSIRSRGDN